MTKIEVNISDELKRKAQQRAAESGFGSLDEYLQSLVESDAQDVTLQEPPGPVQSEDSLETTLIARLGGGPPIEATPEFWSELNNQFAKRDRERSSK